MILSLRVEAFTTSLRAPPQKADKPWIPEGPPETYGLYPRHQVAQADPAWGCVSHSLCEALDLTDLL